MLMFQYLQYHLKIAFFKLKFSLRKKSSHCLSKELLLVNTGPSWIDMNVGLNYGSIFKLVSRLYEASAVWVSKWCGSSTENCHHNDIFLLVSFL